MGKYQSFKPSGIDWIREIPEHWDSLGFTKIIKIRHGYQFREYDFTDDGIRIVKITQLDKDGFLNLESCSFINESRLDEFERILICENDVLMCLTGGTIGKIIKVGKVSEPLVQNYRVGHFSPLNHKISNDYIYWFMSSSLTTSQMFSEIRETGQPNIGMEDFGKMKVILPPFQEQLQIVQFLNVKTELIDKLISTKERKITLLKEQKTSLINQVITKGLNPNVKMKDSGVEWIGEIPEHWGLIKMKHKGDVIIGLSYSPEDIVDEGDGTLVMRSSNVQNGKPSFLDNVYVSTKIPEKIRLKIGDILICSRNGSRHLIGKNCLITKNEEGLTFGVFMTVYRSRHYKFMYWLLNSPIFESQSGLFLTSTINQLTVSTLQNMVLPFTDNENEQNQIVEYLDSKTKEINDLVQLEQKKIDLLKEYRQSLISEVVTGKIKVTN